MNIITEKILQITGEWRVRDVGLLMALSGYSTDDKVIELEIEELMFNQNRVKLARVDSFGENVYATIR